MKRKQTIKKEHIITTAFNWWNFKLFINRRAGIFTRQQMIEYFSLQNNKSAQITMDNYRNYLRAAKYIDTVDRGSYVAIRIVPMNMTVQMVRNVAYLKYPVHQ